MGVTGRAPEGPLAVVAGLLVDGTGGGPQRDRGFLIEDGVIGPVANSDSIRSEARARGLDLLDLTEGSVIPGIVDGHAHLAWGTEDDPGWQSCRDNPEKLAIWTTGSAQRCLAAGVTTIRDCGAPGGVTVRVRDALKSGAASGPRLFVCGPAITTTGGHGEFLGVVADSCGALRALVRTLCRDGVDFIKVMATGGSMDPETNRRRAQYTRQELEVVVLEAHRLRRRVVAHANATEGIRNAVLAGVDTIAHCNWLGVEEGTLEYDRAVVQSMVSQGTSVDLNVSGAMSNLSRGDGVVPAPGFEASPPSDRWDLLAEMRGLGVPIYLTSDRFGPGIAEFPRLLSEAARKWRLPIAEVIWRVTGLPARAMGIAASVGTLEPGRAADFAVYHRDLTTDGRLEAPTAVYLAGMLVGGEAVR